MWRTYSGLSWIPLSSKFKILPLVPFFCLLCYGNCKCCICIVENGKDNFHYKFEKVQRKVLKDGISKHTWQNIALKFWRYASEFNSQLFF